MRVCTLEPLALILLPADSALKHRSKQDAALYVCTSERLAKPAVSAAGKLATHLTLQIEVTDMRFSQMPRTIVSFPFD